MVTHLSVRLCWHDSGWNGRVCKDPEKNNFCSCLDHIRERRDKDFVKDIEVPNKGRHFSEFDCKKTVFPCQGEAGIFADKGHAVRFYHPLKGKVSGYDMDPCVIDPAPYSCCPAPYRWMMVDSYNGILEKENLLLRPLRPEERLSRKLKHRTWIADVDLQRRLLDHFWNQLKAGRSLTVFYVNSSPAAEDTKRVVVGLGRLTDKHKPVFYGNTPKKPRDNIAWQRQISINYPEEGFRLPYQEYVEQGVDTKEIVVIVPQEIDDGFKYVAEHVSDDAMLSLVEKINKSVETIITDINAGKIKLTDDWNKHQRWLQGIISELWENRGQFPGIGSVLQFLGFNRGMTYQKECLIPLEMQSEDVLQHVLDILDGKQNPEPTYEDDFRSAKDMWEINSTDPDRRALLTILMRMEVTEKQVKRLINDDQRDASGIKAKLSEIVNNPYLIAENDKGLRDKDGKLISDQISLDVVDHAMVPSFNIKQKFKTDDYRRVRAVMVEALKNAADEGDTLLSMEELMQHVHDRFQGERQCVPDLFIVKAKRKFFEEKMEFIGDKDAIQFAALNEMRAFEKLVSEKIKSIISERYPDKGPDWKKLMDKRFGEVQSDLELAARAEKGNALEVLYRNKFSVLTGKAGTGKTEVVSLFIQALCEKENAKPSDFLVLAPTGKARIRLKQNFEKIKSADLSKIEPKTIHQHLNELDWLGGNLELKERGGWRTHKDTVIVDECSMVAIDLFGTLLKSLELENISRLIIVGDPNQLPPIGPGRPLDDIVNWLKTNKKYEKNLANLEVRMRHAQKASIDAKVTRHVCLQLADAFLRDYKSKDVEEVYALINNGSLDKTFDLSFAKWEDYDDLLQKLDDVLKEIGVTDYASYRKSVGLTDGKLEKCESWQVLSPLKHREVSGTISLNNYLQTKFLSDTLTKCRVHNFSYDENGYFKPFGSTKDIVVEDKVIQIRNSRQIWVNPPKKDKYVANGEIGIATNQSSKALNVTFSDQLGYEYIYYHGASEYSAETNLELAYAITIHKSQGSDFEKVILIIPQHAFNISMEMMYTALTRFKGSQGKTYLLVQDGIDTLEKYRRANSSETNQRNTYLFKLAVRDNIENVPYAENRIHRTKNGFMVRSKSEVIVANELINEGIQLTDQNYEAKLYAKDNSDYKLPDFTFTVKDKTYYWEHLGMLSSESYKSAWERKKQWYKDNGYFNQLITSQDGTNGSIDSKTIDQIIKEKLQNSPTKKANAKKTSSTKKKTEKTKKTKRGKPRS